MFNVRRFLWLVDAVLLMVWWYFAIGADSEYLTNWLRAITLGFGLLTFALIRGHASD